MRFAALALLACLLATLSVMPAVSADEQDVGAKLLAEGAVRIRVTTGPDSPVLVGSRAYVRLEFLTKSFFKGAPDLPDLEIRRAIVRRESSTAVNGSEQIDGEAYASQMWEYAIYPQRAGPVRIPSLAVVLRVAGEDGDVIEVTARTPHAVLEARLPPGAENLAFVIGASSLTVASHRKPEDAQLKVGGAFRRTLTIEVDGAPAMLIAPLPSVTLEGVAAYPDAPRLDDTGDRGELHGRREESTAYVMQQPGHYEFPEVRIPWWNTRSKVLETAVVPAFSFTVEGGTTPAGATQGSPGAGAREAQPAQRLPWGTLFGVALGLVLLMWLLRDVLRAQVERLAAWRVRRADAEPARFRAFEEACRRGDPAEARRALQHWLDVHGDEQRPATVADLLAGARDPDLERELRALEDRLYGPSPTPGAWSGALLAILCGRARRSLARQRKEREVARALSGQLNPPRPI